MQKRGSNNGESLRKAAEVRKLHNETYDEAWARILALKNSPRDDERLREVQRAMDEGKIGRDSPDKRLSKAEAMRMWRGLGEQETQRSLRDMVENRPAN